ncbi:MAG TPA: FimV/HubP family polar landmark protein, partial [Trinickia sp.]
TQSGASAAGASAALGAVQASAPASATASPASATASASGEAASGAAAVGASSAAASAPRAATPAPASAAAASVKAASHPKVSSLQQLLTLKNRVLMELQRHGFGANSANRTGAGGASAPAGTAGFSTRPAASGAASASAPGQSRVAAAANQRFIGIGGYGVSVARADIPAIAAVVAAVVAALLVLLVALGISRRRRGASATAAPSPGGPATGEGGAAVRPAPLSTASLDDPIEAEFLAALARTPSSKRALMGLAAHYAERKNVRGFDEIAQRIYRLSGGRGPNWVHVASVGRQLDPDNPLFALPASEADESVVTAKSETGVPAAPAIEAAPVAEPPAAPEVPEVAPAAASAEAEPPVRVEPPVASEPAVETPSSADTTVPAHVPPEHEPGAVGEVAPPEAGETPAFEPEASEAPSSEEPERAAAPEREATLPPEAIAALDGLEMGLPPRIDPENGQGAAHLAQADEHDSEQAHERERKGEGAMPASQAESDGHSEAAAPVEPGRNVDRTGHEGDGQPGQESPPTVPAAPAVSGLGAAPIGPLALSFDLDLPGGEAGERAGASAALAESAPTPQFTPEQLARIARNKLDLAGEYIALGDLGGARTLIHEVIESNDAATRDEAQALLATLAPLS